MPRVYLTAAQREEAKTTQRLKALGDGIAIYGAKKRLNQKNLAEDLGLNIRTVSKLLDGKPVALSTEQLFRILEKAGMEVAL